MNVNIRVVQFGVGSQEELNLLASMECPTELIIVVLTHDTDKLYLISNKGCEELTDSVRSLIEGGMFPNITGNITPKFKLMRVDIPTILANSARIAQEMSYEENKKNEDNKSKKKSVKNKEQVSSVIKKDKKINKKATSKSNSKDTKSSSKKEQTTRKSNKKLSEIS